MITGLYINDIWSYRPNASDLYNIERVVNPAGGGGARYIQIRKSQLDGLLRFLRLTEVPQGKYPLAVKNVYEPSQIDLIEFDSKSQERMRIANQNRHWANRVSGWSPRYGFPTLGPADTTVDAEALINQLGGLHIYLARDVNELVWAGFTVGDRPKPEELSLPFVDRLYGEHDGGYWSYEEA